MSENGDTPNLDRIKALQFSSGPDPIAEAEERAALNEEILDRQANRIARKVYARRSYALIIVWLCLDAVVLLCQGLHLDGFSLSDLVLTTLIGGTTASVIGMFVIVLKYVFSKP